MTKITEPKVFHKNDCGRVFKRYDLSCPRCIELAKGAQARKGWGPSRQEMDFSASESIKAHFHSERHLTGGYGVVCTYGEW